jgi:F-type H+-transporting ATPase subunit epsilon
MQVELVSPEKVVFSGEATQVITRTLGGGEIAFLPGHAPFVGALTENHTRITLADGSQLDVAVHGGFVQVATTRSASSATSPSSAPTSTVLEPIAAKDRAEADLRREDNDEAAAALARANARLNATGGGAAGTTH